MPWSAPVVGFSENTPSAEVFAAARPPKRSSCPPGPGRTTSLLIGLASCHGSSPDSTAGIVAALVADFAGRTEGCRVAPTARFPISTTGNPIAVSDRKDRRFTVGAGSRPGASGHHGHRLPLSMAEVPEGSVKAHRPTHGPEVTSTVTER